MVPPNFRHILNTARLPVATRLPHPEQDRRDRADAALIASAQDRFTRAYAEPEHRRALERMLTDMETPR